MYKLVVYVPTAQTEEVKTALFAAGAGRIGNYDCCCWSVAGVGQFRALSGASPFVGDLNEIATVPETRLELVCADELIKTAVAAMIAAHPYEEPAYQIFQVVDVDML